MDLGLIGRLIGNLAVADNDTLGEEDDTDQSTSDESDCEDFSFLSDGDAPTETITIRPSTTLSDLRDLVAQRTGVRSGDQHHFLHDREITRLRDPTTEHTVSNGDVITLRSGLGDATTSAISRRRGNEFELYQEQQFTLAFETKECKRGHVLMMSWAETDLPAKDIKAEEDSIWQAFGGSGYDIEGFKIPSGQSQLHVQQRVRQFVRKAGPDSLLILVYSGHGGSDHSLGLVFSGYGSSDDYRRRPAFDGSVFPSLLRLLSTSAETS